MTNSKDKIEKRENPDCTRSFMDSGYRILKKDQQSETPERRNGRGEKKVGEASNKQKKQAKQEFRWITFTGKRNKLGNRESSKKHENPRWKRRKEPYLVIYNTRERKTERRKKERQRRKKESLVKPQVNRGKRKEKKRSFVLDGSTRRKLKNRTFERIDVPHPPPSVSKPTGCSPFRVLPPSSAADSDGCVFVRVITES
ncbi:hypothetical protein H6P81_005404 [Aristolochia fimbriata]|uniref:Uncharacterized protein n=1 Tax=Aristolochia fimbriata TaxID=158543 RepID=A0AAV7EWJ3_ARIFI|nr:hypothetical protein H6P81_005404 [Aristolochia fimbriata]